MAHIASVSPLLYIALAITLILLVSLSMAYVDGGEQTENPFEAIHFMSVEGEVLVC
ncbi:MAG: hypothetical protein R3332_12035 [Pseudohongiellaceae bacterium]|nr:hypothetical protein [Pseudohongiellaceae bacterium]